MYIINVHSVIISKHLLVTNLIKWFPNFTRVMVRPHNIFEVYQEQSMQSHPQHHGDPHTYCHPANIAAIKHCTRREWINILKRWVLFVCHEKLNFWHLNLYSNRRKAQVLHDSPGPLIHSTKRHRHYSTNTRPQKDFCRYTRCYTKGWAPPGAVSAKIFPNLCTIHRRVWSWMIFPLTMEMTQSSVGFPQRPQSQSSVHCS